MEDFKVSVPELPRLTGLTIGIDTDVDMARKVNELIAVANGHSKVIEVLVETMKKLAGLVEHHDKFLRELRTLLEAEHE